MTMCTHGLRRWIRTATPTPAAGSASSSSGPGGESLDTVLPNTPNLQAWADQYYGVMKLTLRPDRYAWDYESALQSPTTPAAAPPTYSDTGSGTCNGQSS